MGENRREQRLSGKIAALIAFMPQSSEFNGVELDTKRHLGRLTGKKAALTAFNRKNSGTNSV